jgi:hypothetical protein
MVAVPIYIPIYIYLYYLYLFKFVVHPEPVEGSKDERAIRDTSTQSSRIMASFFFLLHPLICRSEARASYRVGKLRVNTNSTGRRLKV